MKKKEGFYCFQVQPVNDWVGTSSHANIKLKHHFTDVNADGTYIKINWF